MEKKNVRTSLDIPTALYRKLRQTAARHGCSARQLVLKSIQQAVEESGLSSPRRRLRMNHPIVRSTGKPFTLTNEQIYGVVEFP